MDQYIPSQIITVEFPGVRETKPRPAVIISTASYHAARPDVIIGLLTSEIAKAVSPTDYHLQDWQIAGLRLPSAFRSYVWTIPKTKIIRVVGHLSDRDWAEVQTRLRLAVAFQ